MCTTDYKGTASADRHSLPRGGRRRKALDAAARHTHNPCRGDCCEGQSSAAARTDTSDTRKRRYAGPAAVALTGVPKGRGTREVLLVTRCTDRVALGGGRRLDMEHWCLPAASGPDAGSLRGSAGGDLQ
ncbi:hypothetical protein NDU88_008043 [Pleurodeles waltl]|uniref:Uncharacterized protein n=1 Tax=Pleurodeles waltl TaxID=8319 RepID=A0AAV7N742_PLEWA|nr:hypothetical protein NDU88_008043 [Pleurodeles waltl]